MPNEQCTAITSGDEVSNVDSARSFAAYGCTAVLVLSTFSLVARYAARRKIRQWGKAEDYLVIAGYLISLVPVVCLYICKSSGADSSKWMLVYNHSPLVFNNGLGCHDTELDAETLSYFSKVKGIPPSGDGRRPVPWPGEC